MSLFCKFGKLRVDEGDLLLVAHPPFLFFLLLQPADDDAGVVDDLHYLFPDAAFQKIGVD